MAQAGITQPLYSVMNALGDQSDISDFIYSTGQAQPRRARPPVSRRRSPR